MLQFIDFLSFSNMPSHENSIAAQVSYRSSTLQFHIAVSHRSTSNFEAQSSHTRTFWVENFNGTNLSQRHIATSLKSWTDQTFITIPFFKEFSSGGLQSLDFKDIRIQTLLHTETQTVLWTLFKLVHCDSAPDENIPLGRSYSFKTLIFLLFAKFVSVAICITLFLALFLRASW